MDQPDLATAVRTHEVVAVLHLHRFARPMTVGAEVCRIVKARVSVRDPLCYLPPRPP
jgi:hypothetical protein